MVHVQIDEYSYETLTDFCSHNFVRSEGSDAREACKICFVEGDNLFDSMPLHSSDQTRIMSPFTRNSKVGNFRKPIGENTSFIFEQYE